MKIQRNSDAFFIYLDNLRKSRNISQEEFTFDVVSMRQYRRYLTGESTISHDVLHKLSEKLNFKLEYIFLEFEAEKLKETQSINTLYNNVVNSNFDEARAIFEVFENKQLLDLSNELLLKHSKNMYDYLKGKITPNVIITKAENLLDINSFFSKTSYTSTELLIAISLFQFRDYSKRELIANKLIDYINNEISVISGHNFRTIILVLQQLTKYYGGISQWEKVLKATNTAIDYSVKMRSFYLLDYLYYYQALVYHRLKNSEKLYEAVYHCFLVLELEDNEAKTLKMKDLILKTLGINLFEVSKRLIDNKNL